MTATYDCIATTTLGSAAATVTFTSISGSYTDLVLVANFGNSAAAYPYLRFNADTGSNYSTTDLYGNGSSAGSARESGGNKIWASLDVPTATGIENNLIIQIQNYSNSTTYKTAISRFNNAASGTSITVGLWRNTSAITSLTLDASNSGVARDYTTNSTFTLYGIKAE
jgi:hypothetical protein